VPNLKTSRIGGEILTRIEKPIEINAPPEKIWPIVEWEKLPEWFETVKKVEWTSKEKNKVGATLHMKAEAAGTKAEYDAEITEWIENEKMAWRTTGGNITLIASSTLTPTKTGTKATFTEDYELPYSVLGKIIDKLRVHKAMEKDAERALKKLKDMAEK
jgi:coenzyme Q-binding protein COQ10